MSSALAFLTSIFVSAASRGMSVQVSCVRACARSQIIRICEVSDKRDPDEQGSTVFKLAKRTSMHYVI